MTERTLTLKEIIAEYGCTYDEPEDVNMTDEDMMVLDILEEYGY